VACTAYILIGIWFEERDLVNMFGEKYRDYRRQVSMLIPGRRYHDAEAEDHPPLGAKAQR
jgi:protein-S-isoprenylcysteine O-methyltransferase Ste14